LLDQDEKWIDDYEGRYSVNSRGRFFSYASGSRYEPKVVTKNGFKYVQVSDGERALDWKISDLVAKTFLRTKYYIFKNGNKLDARLENLILCEDALLPDEVWIEGYENMYSIKRDGTLFSYKRKTKEPLKQSSSLSKSKRVCLSNEGQQEQIYIDRLMSQYF
jgi:hypothetical protein